MFVRLQRRVAVQTRALAAKGTAQGEARGKGRRQAVNVSAAATAIAHTSIVSPVSRSTGMSSPPVRPRSTGNSARTARRQPRPDPTRHHGVAQASTSGQHEPAAATSARNSRRVWHRPARTASVILPDCASVGNVAQIVGHQHRRRQGAHRDRRRQAHPVHPQRLGVLGAEHRHQTEEHEYRDLTETLIAVRGSSRRCTATRRRCRRAPTTISQGLLHSASANPATAADRQADHRGRQHRLRRGQFGAHQPQRTGPLVVGAANAVGVVVGVIDPHDQRHRDHQRQQGLPPLRTV